MTCAPSGTLAEPAAPTDVIRLSVTTISPSGMISSARMVMILAPLKHDRAARPASGPLDHDGQLVGLGLLLLFLGGGLVLVFAFLSLFALERVEDDRIERKRGRSSSRRPR